MGLFWYFFLEMFDHFRLFFLWVLQLNAFIYLIPFTIIFRSVFTSIYFYLSYLPLFTYYHLFLHSFVIICDALLTGIQHMSQICYHFNFFHYQIVYYRRYPIRIVAFFLQIPSFLNFMSPPRPFLIFPVLTASFFPISFITLLQKSICYFTFTFVNNFLIREHTVFLYYILLSTISWCKSYPSVSDLVVPLAMLPLWSCIFRCMYYHLYYSFSTTNNIMQLHD